MTHTLLCLRDHVPENNIFELRQNGKIEVLREITDRAKVLSILQNDLASSDVFHQLLKREQLGSTGIVNGIAIPHCKTDLIQPDMTIFIGYSVKGIEFNAHDGNPVFLVFTVLTRKKSGTIHLAALAAISRMISKHGLSTHISDYLNPEALRRIIDECEYEI
ncbi:MAG: PTS sugar transporter subunit IIA [Acidobacteria bacterium]|nr:PTS sugar transporter subunit IIA [Acidobacteriota bacterium]